MARLPRICPAYIPQHIIQRGNNRQACFNASEDYAVYAAWLREYAAEFEVSVHAWVFMTNHVHLLATPNSEGAISRMMQALGRRYVRYFNKRWERTGTLWEGRFRACLVESEVYLLQCQRYIEMNPVRAGMVASPADYAWSSYHCNALGKVSPLHTPHPEYLKLGPPARRFARYAALVDEALDGALLERIRAATNRGRVLGSEDFCKQLEAALGQPLSPRAVGRPADACC